MNTFYDEYNNIDTDDLLCSLNNTDQDIVKGLIDNETIKFNDFLYLLSPAGKNFLNEMSIKSRELTEKHFGKNIQLYIPIYLSSECNNDCIYCGFNINNKIVRKTLSIDEIKKELKYIKKNGFKNILLLTGDAPEKADINYLKKAVETVKKSSPQISLEIYPMDEKNYKKLIDSGAIGLTIYQETYDKKIYKKVHSHGLKNDFKFRIETPDRALKAGFRKIGIGALLGLSDWRIEAAFLGRHAKYLMKKYWRSEINISFPRLRPSKTGFQPLHEVSDESLVQMILALRLFLPRAGITLSTRESAKFRDHMIGYGVTLMSAGSKTNPGGYETYIENKTDDQFEIEDNRDVDKIVKIIKQKGYYPVFKDWDSQFKGVVMSG